MWRIKQFCCLLILILLIHIQFVNSAFGEFTDWTNSKTIDIKVTHTSDYTYKGTYTFTEDGFVTLNGTNSGLFKPDGSLFPMTTCSYNIGNIRVIDSTGQTRTYYYGNGTDIIIPVSKGEKLTVTGSSGIVGGDGYFFNIYSTFVPVKAGVNEEDVKNIFQPKLDEETDARETADTNLENSIDAEAQTRQDADNQLTADLEAEAEARIAGDNNLQNQVITLQDKTTDISYDSGSKTTIVANNEEIDGDLEVKGNTKLDGTLEVVKKATFDDDVEIKGNLTVDKNEEIKGNLTVDGNINGKGTITLSDSSNNEKFFVDNETGDIRVNQDKVTVDGATGNIETKGTITASDGKFKVDENALMTLGDGTNNNILLDGATGDITTNGTLTLKDSTGNEKYFVDNETGSIRVNTDKFTVDGNTGDVTTKGKITSNGDITTQGGSLTVKDTDGTERFNIDHTTGDVRVNNDKVTIDGNTGDITTQGKITSNDDITSNGGSLTINNSQGTTTFRVDATTGDIYSTGKFNIHGRITGVEDGAINPYSMDAINGRQFYNYQQYANRRMNELDTQTNVVGALAAAMSAMHPTSYDETARTNFSMGYGNYKGENAVAVGVFHYLNEDTLANLGMSFCPSEGNNMLRAGITFSLGKRTNGDGTITKHSQEARKETVRQTKEIVSLKEQLNMVKEQLGMVMTTVTELTEENEEVRNAVNRKNVFQAPAQPVKVAQKAPQKVAQPKKKALTRAEKLAQQKAARIAKAKALQEAKKQKALALQQAKAEKQARLAREHQERLKAQQAKAEALKLAKAEKAEKARKEAEALKLAKAEQAERVFKQTQAENEAKRAEEARRVKEEEEEILAIKKQLTELDEAEKRAKSDAEQDALIEMLDELDKLEKLEKQL